MGDGRWEMGAGSGVGVGGVGSVVSASLNHQGSVGVFIIPTPPSLRVPRPLVPNLCKSSSD